MEGIKTAHKPLPKAVAEAEIELTKEQRAVIITIANSNLLVGLVGATQAQAEFMSTRELMGKKKQDYIRLMRAFDVIKKGWAIESPMSLTEADKISDQIHDILFDFRAKMVKTYSDFATGKNEIYEVIKE